MESNNTTSIPKGSLSTADLDVLAGMAIVFMHCADKCVQMIENQYAIDYMAGKYFKDLCKKEINL